jgi:hypothetical protein
MDVKSFTRELLAALAENQHFERVALQTEGPIANGYAYLREDFFLRFYFNEVTGTLAFALIERDARIWGIDCDNRRGWHLHPAEHPDEHVDIEPLSVSEIIERLQRVLLERD